MGRAEEKSTLKSILLPVGIAVAFLLWGLTIFFLVGDRGSGEWVLGSHPDVPGQSPFSTEGTHRNLGSLPGPKVNPARPQHVDGREENEVNPFAGGTTP
jgi:hypothetical protein